MRSGLGRFDSTWLSQVRNVSLSKLFSIFAPWKARFEGE